MSQRHNLPPVYWRTSGVVESFPQFPASCRVCPVSYEQGQMTNRMLRPYSFQQTLLKDSTNESGDFEPVADLANIIAPALPQPGLKECGIEEIKCVRHVANLLNSGKNCLSS
jgi:hypothetical protein